jgi:autotransporter-associated beta strand protein
VLNNPADMLDSTPNYQPWDLSGSNAFNLGGQWQIFIQAYSDSTVGGNPGDFGGCEIWMGQNYGNLPWIADSSDSYTNDAWTAKLATFNHPTLLATGNTVALQAGDVVAITSCGLEYEGMMNINQQHYVGNPITITALETGVPLPAPTVTSLGQLMDSSGNFYFDAARQSGAEHLQGTLVELASVRLLSGTWAPNNQVVVTDGSLRQMILNLGNNPNLTSPPAGAFNVTGIEDQESTDGSNQDGYTLWVTDSGSVSPLANSGKTFNWTGTSGSWNAAANWNLGSKPQNASDVAILGGSLALAATVTLDGSQKAGCLIFANSNTATSGYTLSPGTGGTLTLDNSGAAALLTVISGSHAITAPLALADNLDAGVAAGGSLTLSGGIGEDSSGLSLTKDGGGQLVLSGTNTYSGGTLVDAGRLVLASDTAVLDGSNLSVGADTASTFAPAEAAAPIVSSAAVSQVNPVPEPCTLALLAVAIVIVGGTRRVPSFRTRRVRAALENTPVIGAAVSNCPTRRTHRE